MSGIDMPKSTDAEGTVFHDAFSVDKKAESPTISFRGRTYTVPSDRNGRGIFDAAIAYLFSGQDTFLAQYDSGGGWAYPVRRFDMAGKCLWSNDAWSVGRVMLIGSAWQFASLAVHGDEVAAFSGGDCGAAMEVFRISDGKLAYRFCSTYWFNFSEAWNVPWGKADK